MESKKGIKIAQLEEMNAQAGFRIGTDKMAEWFNYRHPAWDKLGTKERSINSKTKVS